MYWRVPVEVLNDVLLPILMVSLSVPFDQALFGFGDAVCVPAIEWIANNYINPIIEEILQQAAQTTLQEAQL